ncbi:N-acetylglucosamine-6-phosphate deacetylase [Leptolyngbya sp. FACHB-321]|uniref:N-acetylglucosamine-6-phosphate deacetylase n=1 Tax=Leptolyngbya sp. FACHB-321 TaxID=2692807 RepID=UPI001682AF3A|nr:N-acetylglucosamine-6-phosphate deacetylase [Leptolyngbya sp. FACHB-321]MBD2035927.1 N-acetylglucosamine-6-phosphate deacetylase [Leptolyngbya sp. FACHB-321]
MAHPTLELINARLPGYEGLQRLAIEQHTIRAIAPMSAATCLPSLDVQQVDMEGDWLSLGGIDLQINGALGLAFPDLSDDNSDKLHAISQFLWNQGVDGFLPTIVTTSIENIQRSLALLSSHSPLPTPHSPISQILGVHLEGPCLNPDKRGAHPAEYLLPLTINTIKRLLGDYASVVKVMTLAPELDPTGRVIPYLRSLGITVSLGHSQATASQAQQAFDQGATMVTHAFNAMPGLHHREPGLLGAAIVHPQVYCGLIADGQHVSPIMMDLLLRASQYDRGVFLVSDALSPLGLPDGIYPWDTRQIEVKNGTARLPDGTLSGTTLSLLVGAQNLVKMGTCDVETAIALATIAPRRAIGLPTNLIGQPANLLQWHQSDYGELSWQRL